MELKEINSITITLRERVHFKFNLQLAVSKRLVFGPGRIKVKNHVLFKSGSKQYLFDPSKNRYLYKS